MNHIEKAKELNLPPEDFVIVGGSVLDIHGIRSSDDFDVVVSPEAFAELRDVRGWETDQEFKEKWNRERLVNGIFEVSTDLVFEFEKEYTFTFQFLKSISQKIDGLYVQPLAFLALCKAHVGRDKDAKDIELINKYFDSLKK